MALVKSEGRIVARYATMEDYNDILAINRNIMEGYDYIPVFYEKFLADDKTRVYLLELDGTTARFIAYTVVDGDKTAFAQTARIKEEYKGAGHFHAFEKMCINDIKRQFPTVQEVILTAVLNPFQLGLVAVKLERFQILQVEALVMLKGEESTLDLSATVNSNKKYSIDLVALPKLQSVLEENQKLLGNYIMITFQSYKMSHSNISYIVNKMHPVCYVSALAQTEGRESVAYSGISLGTSFEVESGMVVFLFARGKTAEEIALHLRSQMKYVYQNSLKKTQQFYLYLVFPKDIGYGAVFQTGFQMGLSPTLQDTGVLIVQSSKATRKVLDGFAKL